MVLPHDRKSQDRSVPHDPVTILDQCRPDGDGLEVCPEPEEARKTSSDASRLPRAGMMAPKESAPMPGRS
jgi:hypothetical protein